MKRKSLIKYLGRGVKVPFKNEPWVLVEIYSNGNVGCVPCTCINYKRELREFHAKSIKKWKKGVRDDFRKKNGV